MDLDNIQRKYGLPAPLPVVQNGKFAPRFPLNLEHRGDDVFQFGGKYIGEIENIYDLLYKILTNQEIDASLALPYAIKITEDKLYIRDKTNSEWILIFDITKPNFPKEIELYELIYKAITHQVIGEDTSYPGQFKIEENILYVRDKDNLTWTQIGDVTKEFLGATEATQDILDQINEILTEVQELKTELNRQIATTNETLTLALQASNEAMTSAQSINIRTFNSVEEMKASNTLKAGALVKTQGFYQSGDGGGADYVITNDIGEDEVDEASIIALQKGLYAKLQVQDCLNVKQFGAKGDKATDDTEALQKAINFCKTNDNVSVLLLPEGNYKTTDTLNIYLDKFAIKGNGNANIIPYMDSSIALVFTMNENVNYLDRYKHNRKSGGFSILGDNTTNTTLMTVGDGEKSVNCCEFENIFLTNAATLLHCKAHTYKNNFYNIILNASNDSEQPAFIYDNKDTSEANNFFGCSFWSTRTLKIQAECNFYGCTIHFRSHKIEISNGKVNFTDCHFEILNNPNTIDRAVLVKGLAIFNNCNFVCSQDNSNFINNFFATGEYGDIPIGIFFNNCNFKYFLGRLTSLDKSSLCSGEVYINNTPMNYAFDAITLKYVVYDYTDTSFYLDKNNYIYHNLTADDVTIEKNETTDITITGYHENYSIAKRYLIPSNAKSINYIRDFTSQNNISFIFGGEEIPTIFQGLTFYDYFMNKLPIKNSEKVATSEIKYTYNYWLPIPPNAVYLDIGFYINGLQNGNVININKYGVEFL